MTITKPKKPTIVQLAYAQTIRKADKWVFETSYHCGHSMGRRDSEEEAWSAYYGELRNLEAQGYKVDGITPHLECGTCNGTKEIDWCKSRRQFVKFQCPFCA